jgi:hypothetical protein
MRVLLLTATILLLAACGSGRSEPTLGSVAPRNDYVWQTASRISSGCAHRDATGSDAYGLLWLRAGPRPFVYYLEDQLPRPDVVSSGGDHFPVWGEFWPCRTPVAIYVRGRPMMTALASDRAQRKTLSLGRFGNASWVIAANGRLVFYRGRSIRPAGGKEFTARLPKGWLISSLSPSPRDPSVLLVRANTSPHVPGGCRGNDEYGGIFLVTPSASTKLKAYDACRGGAVAEWSPDGRQILWFLGTDQQHLFLSDARGRHLRELVGGHTVCGALWSPDGKAIAWGYNCNRAHVLDLATGRSRYVGEGRIRAWSPDGKALALERIHRPWYGPGSPAEKIVSVPVDGGPTHLLIKIPATKS